MHQERHHCHAFHDRSVSVCMCLDQGAILHRHIRHRVSEEDPRHRLLQEASVSARLGQNPV